MAKKFGKFLLVTTALASAAAAAYYYLQKKDGSDASPEDDDYDDFSEDLEEEAEAPHSYVPLNSETAAESSPAEEETDFTPLAETVSQAQERTEETVEEFFDEEEETPEEE